MDFAEFLRRDDTVSEHPIENALEKSVATKWDVGVPLNPSFKIVDLRPGKPTILGHLTADRYELNASGCVTLQLR